jgi:membrane protein required for colicin V production
MPALDWVFLGVLTFSLLLGAWRGLVFEVISVASWLAAFVLAQWFAPEVAHKLPMAGAAEPVRYAAGFVLVFIASVFAGGLVAALVKKLVSVVGLSPVDRVLGAAFGFLRGLLIALAATVVVGMTALKTTEWWQASQGAAWSSTVLKGLKPVLPEEFGKYLP